MRKMIRGIVLALILMSVVSVESLGQISYERLTHATEEPQNWLTYSGNCSSDRYSDLDEITPANVSGLQEKWLYQTGVFGLS